MEIFCEETIALLAHEILCCEGESDSEAESGSGSESDGLDVGAIKAEKAQDQGQLDGSLEYGLQHPYQLMFSEEDEDGAAKGHEDDGQSHLDNSMTSQTFLLTDEDDPGSEEKSEAKKEAHFD